MKDAHRKVDPKLEPVEDDPGHAVACLLDSRTRKRLWADLDCDPAELMVVMEPTRNAWIPVAAWFRRRGVKVVMVPTTQSADLREY